MGWMQTLMYLQRLSSLSLLINRKYSAQVTVRQFFSGGAACDLTGEPREAHAVFQCDPDVKFARFVSIQESTICKFVAFDESCGQKVNYLGEQICTVR
jgi:hypothetical protein